MVKGLQAERLALCVGAQIDLETIRIDDRNVGVHSVQRRSRFRNVLRDMSTTASEHFVDDRDAILRCLNLDKVNGLRNER